MGTKLHIDPDKSGLYLGIGSNHDFSGCLVRDGKIYRAIEAERINRLKHSQLASYPFKSVLKYLFHRKMARVAALAACDILSPKHYYQYRDQIRLFNHHLCHAGAVYYTSPFSTAAVFVADGSGSIRETASGYSFETYSYYLAKGQRIKLLGKQTGEVDETLDETHAYQLDIPNSLGMFYQFVTRSLGFNFLDDGKTMGLSAYGNPDKFYRRIRNHFEFGDRGMIYHNFGLKEVEYYTDLISRESDEKKKFQLKADLAAAAQKVFEEGYFYCLNHLYRITKCRNLCLGGGIVLNSAANGKIRQKTPFENIHYFPGCGDDAIAVGAAFLAYHEDHPHRKREPQIWQSPFLGKTFTNRQIEAELKKSRVRRTVPKDIYRETARQIARGKIVGWFQGGGEFGPRALGHRSIVADPRDLKMKDYLNERVKKREPFRPFAPAILEEQIHEYFDQASRSPYMLEVFPIKKSMQRVIPAVVHADGTGRIQTVGPQNKEFYCLIREFYRLTGVPVILNTSFNINKMPIVETPRDAIDCFLNTNIDFLVIGKYLCTKTS